jgi:hypothetical protein
MPSVQAVCNFWSLPYGNGKILITQYPVCIPSLILPLPWEAQPLADPFVPIVSAIHNLSFPDVCWIILKHTITKIPRKSPLSHIFLKLNFSTWRLIELPAHWLVAILLFLKMLNYKESKWSAMVQTQSVVFQQLLEFPLKFLPVFLWNVT